MNNRPASVGGGAGGVDDGQITDIESIVHDLSPFRRTAFTIARVLAARAREQRTARAMRLATDAYRILVDIQVLWGRVLVEHSRDEARKEAQP